MIVIANQQQGAFYVRHNKKAKKHRTGHRHSRAASCARSCTRGQATLAPDLLTGTLSHSLEKSVLLSAAPIATVRPLSDVPT